MSRDKIEVEKFKKLVKEMFRGYPNYFYFGMVEPVIGKDRIIDLVRNKFLVKTKTVQNGKKVDAYYLGVNALPIVSAWKTEEFAWETKELTRQIKILTWVIIGLTIISIIISIASLFN